MFKLLLNKINTPKVKEVTAQVVHEEMLTASDKAYEEALSIINKENMKDIELISELQSIGFNNHPTVQKYKKDEEIKQEAVKAAKVITRHREKVPYYKFISIKDAVYICNKYDLICSSVENFIGEIPKDKAKQLIHFNKSLENHRRTFYILKELEFGWINDKEKKIIKDKFDKLDNVLKIEIIQSRDRLKLRQILSDNISDIYIKPITSMLICAKSSDFIKDTTDLFENSSKNVKFIVKEDPIPLIFNGEGFYIGPCWGEEASNPLVINENNN